LNNAVLMAGFDL